MTEPAYHKPQPRSRAAIAVRMIIMLLIFGGIAASVAAFQTFSHAMGAKFAASMKNAPQVVSTARATKQPWQESQSAVASLRAIHGTDLAFEISGIVDQILFKSGMDVQAGTVLAILRLNDAPGRLDALKAQEKLAEITIARDRKQFAAQAVPQAALDADSAALTNIRAQLAQQQALLDQHVLRAPFAGHLGIRQVDPGQYVSPGAIVVTVQALDPIYADFYLPQQAVRWLKTGQPVTLSVDAYPGGAFAGEITALNPKIDPANRNIEARARLPNPAHRLLPGMYGVIHVASAAPEPFLTIPQTAITFNPYGDTVYVVTHKNNQGQAGLFVRQRFIKTGETRGDQIQVLSGLHDGDSIVTSGQTKLRNDTLITINNAVQPASDPSPTPQE